MQLLVGALGVSNSRKFCLSHGHILGRTLPDRFFSKRQAMSGDASALLAIESKDLRRSRSRARVAAVLKAVKQVHVARHP